MAKLLIKFFILFVFFFGCKNITSEKIIKKENTNYIKKSSDTIAKKTSDNHKIEYDVFEIDSMSLKKKKIFLNLESFNNTWKKPDSIITYKPECGSLEGEVVKKYFFEGIVFESFDSNVYLNEFDFTKSNLNILHPKLALNNQTNINEFISLFPNSYRERSESKNNNRILSTLRFITKEGWDEYIHLLFEDGKLKTLLIWNPC